MTKKFIKVKFPNGKIFHHRKYQKLHTFPISENTLNAYKEMYKDTHIL